jgi:ferredoxin-NADP reductase
MATKYIFAINKKHIFNPVAIAVVLTTVGFTGSASWWVGTKILAPFVLIGGILMVRKIKRDALVNSFFVSAIITTLTFTLISGSDLIKTIEHLLFTSSLFFLGFIMLTEPLTTPPTKKLQIIYGAIVGLLFAPQIHIGNFYATPEIALVIGNVFSFIVSPKYKLLLKLKDKVQYGLDTIDFNFSLDKKIAFIPGQYMEWTLPHKNVDSRGNRRYLTIASSPTEDTLRLGVKFNPDGSSFKKNLISFEKDSLISGGQLAGDFTLPKDPKQKCVFLAGGIGITPFRSMIKYLIDMNEKRDIILFYTNKIASEIAYANIFDEASRKLGIKTIYTLTDEENIPKDWIGNIGRINAQMIQTEVSDYKERHFYLSGPHQMITNCKQLLKEIGVKESKIKTDYFPGFA